MQVSSNLVQNAMGNYTSLFWCGPGCSGKACKSLLMSIENYTNLFWCRFRIRWERMQVSSNVLQDAIGKHASLFQCAPGCNWEACRSLPMRSRMCSRPQWESMQVSSNGMQWEIMQISSNVHQVALENMQIHSKLVHDAMVNHTSLF